VGDHHRIYLPDIGRQRGGQGHLRGLRHIRTSLGKANLSKDDITDITKLRLDAVGVLEVQPSGEPGSFAVGFLNPTTARKRQRTERVDLQIYHSVHELEANLLWHLEEIEKAFGQGRNLKDANESILKAAIVGVYQQRDEASWRLGEMRELATTAGVGVELEVTQLRPKAEPRFVVGRGKLEEVVLECLDRDIELIIFDHSLAPAQARAVAAFSDLKVIDRTQLILDIFAQHARSRDGKLQVELAQLKYNLPRLTDLDAGLSRLTGGIGGRGPGETKLEINRRRARDRISRLETEISNLSKKRNLARQQRQKSGVPVVSVVGYTNAGKSTLVNTLTSSDVLVADQLFATLDPTTRQLFLPSNRNIVITDTVGFIRELPPDLVKAFRATLEELERAHLLLHVVDVSDPMRDAKIGQVEKVLADLNLSNIPRLLVYNKSDLSDDITTLGLSRRDSAICVSAAKRTGISELLKTIDGKIEKGCNHSPTETGPFQEPPGHTEQTASYSVGS